MSFQEASYYVRLQALIQSMLEDAVGFEEEALREIGGKKILAFIGNDRRTAMALNDLYILKLFEYIETGGWEPETGRRDYPPAYLEFLIGYVTNKYPMRAKIKDFMKKIKAALREV